MRRVSLVALLALLCGCDPDIEILGTVVASDGGVPSATLVELSCTGGPQLAVPKTAATDSKGRFALRGSGCLPPSCVLFTGAGFRRAEVHLMEWCKASSPSCAPGTCTSASVTIVLP